MLIRFSLFVVCLFIRLSVRASFACSTVSFVTKDLAFVWEGPV